MEDSIMNGVFQLIETGVTIQYYPEYTYFNVCRSNACERLYFRSLTQVSISLYPLNKYNEMLKIASIYEWKPRHD